MTFNCQRSKQNQGCLNRTRQADSPVISEYTNLKKLLVVGREKKKNPARQCKVCAAHKKRSETRYTCKSAWFRFTKGIVLRNTIQRKLDYLHAVSAVSGSEAQSTVSNRKYEQVTGLNIQRI